MITTVLITIYVTLGVVAYLKEISKPYNSGELWLLIMILSPYTLILDFIDEYKESKKLEGDKTKIL